MPETINILVDDQSVTVPALCPLSDSMKCLSLKFGLFVLCEQTKSILVDHSLSTGYYKDDQLLGFDWCWVQITRFFLAEYARIIFNAVGVDAMFQ